MRVLFLVTDDWFFWSHRLHLARAAREAGFDVHVATSDGDLRGRIEAEGFAFHPVRFGRRVLSQARNAGLLVALVGLYRRLRPDLVHHVSFLPIVYGTLAARTTKVPAVVNAVTGLGHVFSSTRAFHPLRWAVERAYRTSLRGENVRVLLQNPDDERLLSDRRLVEPGRTVVVPGSGVDLERFRPAPEEPGTPVVLCCSRMLWSKGVGVLVDAGRILRERGVPHELRLVGRPHPSNPDSIPERELAAWEAAGEARWLGFRDDVPDMLRAAHVVSLPSYYREGVPMALIEGAASGRSLVGADTPGCREIVIHGENGLLVPAREPEALADALGELLADPERRRDMGRAGRALVERRFSKDVVNAGILDVYRELLDGAWPSAPEGVRVSIGAGGTAMVRRS